MFGERWIRKKFGGGNNLCSRGKSRNYNPKYAYKKYLERRG